MEQINDYSYAEQDRPVLGAELRGGEKYPDFRGKVFVYVLPGGIYLQGDFNNMPVNRSFGFHVHEGVLCENKGEKLLILPDIISDSSGVASMQVYLDSVTHTNIAGRPVVAHLKGADGKDAESIACGLLRRIL